MLSKLASGPSYILGYEFTRNPAFKGFSVLAQINRAVFSVSCEYRPFGIYTTGKNSGENKK